MKRLSLKQQILLRNTPVRSSDNPQLSLLGRLREKLPILCLGLSAANIPRWANRRVWAQVWGGLQNVNGYMGFEFLKVLLEQGDQFPGLHVISHSVGPGVARVEYLGIYARYRYPHSELEVGI
jgi:hypothetical protein